MFGRVGAGMLAGAEVLGGGRADQPVEPGPGPDRGGEPGVGGDGGREPAVGADLGGDQQPDGVPRPSGQHLNPERLEILEVAGVGQGDIAPGLVLITVVDPDLVGQVAACLSRTGSEEERTINLDHDLGPVNVVGEGVADQVVAVGAAHRGHGDGCTAIGAGAAVVRGHGGGGGRAGDGEVAPPTGAEKLLIQ